MFTVVDDMTSSRSKTPANWSVPVPQTSRTRATAKVASPTAFMTNAFLAAAIAAGRWCQKPIRR